MDQMVPGDYYNNSSKQGYTKRARRGGTNSYQRDITSFARRSGTRSNYRGSPGVQKSSGSFKYIRFNTQLNPRFPRPEVKWIDQILGTLGAGVVAITNNGANIYCINQTPQGTGSNSRIGLQIGVKSCYYQFVLNFGTTMVPIVLRHILFWDRQSNGVLCTASDLLAQSTNLLTSPLNLANRDRFVILADDRTTLSSQGEQIRFMEGFRKINQISTYTNVGTIPQTGALNVLFISDETTGDNYPTVYGNWRTRFIDN